MVKRAEAKGFDRFEGTVENVEIEPCEYGEGDKKQTGTQYHLTIKPHNVEIKGKTGKMHEWIRLTPTTKPDSVPEGSILDRYLTEMETVMPELKKIETHPDAFKELKGKKFLFIKKKLGKAFEGKEAKEYWTPIAKL